MCELFAICAKQKTPANEYLRKFFAHGNEHPNGWGFATFDGDDVHLEKEPENSANSRYLSNRLRAPITERVLLAHIRYATVGSLEYENCHPFTRRDASGRAWTLVHNGTIFNGSKLGRYVYVQEGGTDSERVLCHIVETINAFATREGRYPSPLERFELADRVVSELSDGNKLNLIFYDGEYLYVHMNMLDSLHYKEIPGGLVFATVPLDGLVWKTVPSTTLCVYCEGELAYQGTSHHKVFVDNPEDRKFLFLDYSGL